MAEKTKGFKDILAEISEALIDHSNYIKGLIGDHGKIRDNNVKTELKHILDELVRSKRELSGLGELHEQTREKIAELSAKAREFEKKIELLTAPPQHYATVISIQEDTVDVMTRGQRVRVFSPGPEVCKDLAFGVAVLLNESMAIIGVGRSEQHGKVCTVDSVIDESRVRVTVDHDEKRVCGVSGALRDKKFSVGDELLCDLNSGIILECLEKTENKELWLEEVKPIEYSQIGGLRDQVLRIRKEIEMPFLHKDLFVQYGAEMVKGILLYGPPGCGKTLIAKAVAWHIAKKLAEVHNNKEVRGYFINVKGPQLLDKFVGETERRIREMFARAKERATESCPVIIFMDEADALLKTRGTGVSSDVEMTTVAQFLSELDGVDVMKNVLVLVASNRQDLIDPAVLRPGRVDRKIKIIRPDLEGAKEIFRVYLTRKQIPLHKKYLDSKDKRWKPEYGVFKGERAAVIEYLIDGVVKRLWAIDEEKYSYMHEDGRRVTVRNSILELTLQGGGKRTLYLKDFVSGAMIENIVSRAKRNTIERVVLCGPEDGGVMLRDLCLAVEQEMAETEDLPNTSEDAQRWLDMQSIGERVVHIRSLVSDRRKELEEVKSVETVPAGHYL